MSVAAQLTEIRKQNLAHKAESLAPPIPIARKQMQTAKQKALRLPEREVLKEKYPGASDEILDVWEETERAYLQTFDDIGVEGRYGDTSSRGKTGAQIRQDALRKDLFSIAFKMDQFRAGRNKAKQLRDNGADAPDTDKENQDQDERRGLYGLDY